MFPDIWDRDIERPLGPWESRKEREKNEGETEQRDVGRKPS